MFLIQRYRIPTGYRLLGWIWYCTVLENLVLRLGQEIVRISNQTNANSREEAYLGR